MSDQQGTAVGANDNSPPRTPPRHKKRTHKSDDSHRHQHQHQYQHQHQLFGVNANEMSLEEIKPVDKCHQQLQKGPVDDAAAVGLLENGERQRLLQASRHHQQWPRVNFNKSQAEENQPLHIKKFPEQIQIQLHNSATTDTNNTMRIKTLTSLPTMTTTTPSSPPARDGTPASHAHHDAPKIWRNFVENWVNISELVGLLAIFTVIWMLAFVLMPSYVLPNTAIMRMAFLFVGAQLSGILVTFVRLPDMLGMLFFGVLYTNVGLANFSDIEPLEKFLRKMALINIMLLAGLGLDGSAFRKLWTMIMRLTLIPTVAEVTVIAILSRYMLNMPWLWGVLLGLVITAVSPNVVVTVMLKLKEERLGLNKGIHTLIYAMTSCNDVVAIFLFGVISGVIFSQGSLTEQILQGPIGIGIGVVFGYLYGLTLQFVPSKKSGYRNGQRFVLTVLGGTISVLGSEAIGYPSAGALGCMTIAFVAGLGWKRQQEKQTLQQQLDDANSSVPKRLDLLWKFLKPVSFALIGKEIHFSVLDGQVVGYGVLLVLIGSLFRLAFAYISTYGGQLTTKERAYITISGFPKATVQAALGPIALDLARSLNANDETLSLASRVLVISVLAIIFTAPLGAILMLRLAPLWLERSVGELPTNAVGTPGQDLSRESSQRNERFGKGAAGDGSDDGYGRDNKSQNVFTGGIADIKNTLPPTSNGGDSAVGDSRDGNGGDGVVRRDDEDSSGDEAKTGRHLV